MRRRRKEIGVALIEEQLALMQQEGESGRAWDALECASRHCLAMGDASASEMYGARAAECARLALGARSEEYEGYAKLAGAKLKPAANGRKADKMNTGRR